MNEMSEREWMGPELPTSWCWEAAELVYRRLWQPAKQELSGNCD